jgi:hypothetical protein
MGRWMEKLNSHIEKPPREAPTKPTETPFVSSVSNPQGDITVPDFDLARSELIPDSVIYALTDPDRDGWYVAYRKRDRKVIGRGPSQIEAVLDLGRLEDEQ